MFQARMKKLHLVTRLGIFCTLDIVSGDGIVQQKFLFHNLFSPLCLLGEIEIKVHGSYISINII